MKKWRTPWMLLLFFSGTLSLAADYRLDPVLDSVLIGTAGALTGTFFFLDPYPTEGNPAPDSWGMEEAWAGYSAEIDTVSDLSAVLTLGLPVLIPLVSPSGWWETGVMYTETVLLTQGIKELLKSLFLRPRPFAPTAFGTEVDAEDLYDSFPSGHTALSMASAVFTLVLLADQPMDPWLKWGVIGATSGGALVTGTLRLLSGAHYFTDVLAGAGLGALIGWLVPSIHLTTSDGIADRRVDLPLINIRIRI